MNVLLIAGRSVRRVIDAEKDRPRCEVDSELCLGSFQLCGRQKTTHARQIRDKLRIEGFPAKGHWVEAIDIVPARLKLIRLEEELRYVYPVALDRITRAVINRVHPAIETKIIRFAAEEIQVLLAHEEVRVVNWVRAIHRLVISDCNRRYG